ncbi:MAG: Ger(x)C family spore germination protein [Syntrophomonadaceae bacterium]
MLKVRKKIIVMVLLLIPVFVTGCWDNIDLKDRIFVVGAGLDKSSNGKYEYTVQVVKPSAIGARKQGSTIRVTETFTCQGVTVFDAVRNMATKGNKRLYYGQIQVIVIGEDVAREGISDALDWFARDTEPDKRSLVLIARNTTAREVLTIESDLEDIPAVEIADTLRNRKVLPKIKDCQLNEILKSLDSMGTNAVIGIVAVPSNKEKLTVVDLIYTGGAVFDKDKLAGWLTPQEITGYLFTQNKVESGIINITNPFDPQGKIAIEITRSQTKLGVRFKDGNPILNIQIKQEGNLGEQQGGGDLTSFDQVTRLEKETAQVIKRDVMKTINRAQDYKIDIFGFGDIVHRHHLQYWRQVENDWNEIFSTLPVEIEVESKIRRAGLIKRQVGEPNV